ncbi:MAG: bifunctional 5,10-methylenetetrahydrofolate dehydrogenase/5,10-methenyltetrahydrofolate cyclohydrolase, partial [Clostridia bacterium]
MVQQPLPARYNNSLILSAINVNKDADCLCDVSLARLYRGESVFTPATPTAVICLLDYYNIDVFGKNITVIGRGNAVGKPLSLMLTARNATVTLCHSKTENLLTHTANADIIICATGKNNLLNADMISSSAIVLDVGLNFVNGHTCGDVDFQSVSIVAKAISPVPGGIGVVTTATLLRNTLTACKLNTAKLVK